MTVEDPRPGDRFRVVFEGTFRAAPNRLHVGESAGLPWDWFLDHAVSVERISPAIEPGQLYMDADGNGWEADRHYLYTVPNVSVSGRSSVSHRAAHTLPGLRRARLIPDDQPAPRVYAEEPPSGCA